MKKNLTENIRGILDELGYPYDESCLKSITERLKFYESIEADDVESEWLYYSRMNE